ncbi:ATP-dependent zinc metalloprotease FtsH [Buchnera aphidicola (Periphyllus koelreuteriae)]|uniref:ATP-dependent zinc metalloprotease FtsH n=1 Tax=Buchnera aphidicola TaxID=9 RepID=UPI0031B8788E
MVKKMLIWSIFIIIFTSIFRNFHSNDFDRYRINYSTFLSEVNQKKIRSVIIDGQEIYVTKKDNSKYCTFLPLHDSNLLTHLVSKNVKIQGKNSEEVSFLWSVFISWFPMIMLIVAWIFFIRQIQISGKGAMSFGKNKAKIFKKNEIKTTFSDVAGCDEAKEDVKELVDYLKNPKKFKKLGGISPKGLLMVGQPGTGKTLLAKAIAGEANVPFFIISGSDFVEMFIGVGASRVRDMFEKSRKLSPCIIFIDEIDAVGRKRGTGLGGGNDEREQTLNQILVEMDGFDKNEGVILIAATNRPDVLDPALLRPGRFDRQVFVPLPDIKGREQILNVHVKKIAISKDFNSTIIARGTPGFSGADLANLVNESALFAARRNHTSVLMDDFEKAKDKIMMGPERKSMIMSVEQKEYIAYHEAGHAIVGKLVPEHDPVHKVTIIPRGNALGLTFFLPKTDHLSISKKKIESQIATLYGGRIAEEIIYGEDFVSTGASNDIKVATNLAKNMVIKWGFSKKLGPLLYCDEEILLERSSLQSNNFSNYTKKIIDQEIKEIIDINYLKARKIIEKNLDILHSMKNALIKYETINTNQIDLLMNRKFKME